MTNFRLRYEERERQILSPRAVLACESKGRVVPEPPCPIRTVFQRDRDRIIHSKAFRRLKHKTQVFINPEGDHFRTRLTHTLEVAQISRTVARALCLNEDLTETIALGHDLGHTPFGHTGEKALTEAGSEYIPGFEFHHYEQSLRVVDILEYLNLTYEVRDGILRHSKGKSNISACDVLPTTLEGRIVRICDRVAYINHDIDDAAEAGILNPDDLPKSATDILGKTRKERINRMVTDMIVSSENEDDIKVSPEIAAATDELKDFMFSNVYLMTPEFIEAKNMIKEMFRQLIEKEDPSLSVEEKVVRVCDFISGMTDSYSLNYARKLSILT